jgi:heme exporter protein CcmD
MIVNLGPHADFIVAAYAAAAIVIAALIAWVLRDYRQRWLQAHSTICRRDCAEPHRSGPPPNWGYLSTAFLIGANFKGQENCNDVFKSGLSEAA